MHFVLDMHLSFEQFENHMFTSTQQLSLCGVAANVIFLCVLDHSVEISGYKFKKTDVPPRLLLYRYCRAFLTIVHTIL